MSSLHERFRDRADFAFVYVAEAHASDEWQLPANLEDQVVLPQQTTIEQRLAQAREAAVLLRLELPLYLDTLANDASRAFAAWPERLVLVSAERTIAYPGAPGPQGFSPDDAEQALFALLG